jgi:hypothetical protein
MEIFEGFDDRTLFFAQHPQQHVFGPDVIGAQALSLALRGHDDPDGPFGKPFKHKRIISTASGQRKFGLL